MDAIGRNDPCHCGSGKKYKKCCEEKDQAKERAQVEKTWSKAEKEFEKAKKDSESKSATQPGGAVPPPQAKLPSPPGAHMPKHASIPVPKFNMPRKTGGG
jgi:hypothetical protein